MRKALIEPETMTVADWMIYYSDKNKVAAVYGAYIRLAVFVPQVWKQRRRAFSQLANVEEALVRAELPVPTRSEDALIAEAVHIAAERLCEGWQLRAALRTAGGMAAGDLEIRSALAALGYDGDAVVAIQKARTLSGAASRYVAYQTGKTPETIQVSRSRAKRALLRVK